MRDCADSSQLRCISGRSPHCRPSLIQEVVGLPDRASAGQMLLLSTPASDLSIDRTIKLNSV
jgi:hypothetical protein